MKFLIWGTGSIAENGYKLYHSMNVQDKAEIVGFVDNNKQKWGELFNGKKIFSPNQLDSIEWDAISIWVLDGYRDIEKQIVNDLNVSSNRIIDIYDYLKQMICEKYALSDDIEVQECINRLKQKRWLEVYNFEPQKPSNVLQEVYYDENAGLYYTFFENKRMYLKRSYEHFVIKRGKRYVYDFWSEQDINSPHLYEEGKVTVEEGDVLIDAGVCEGNFSLHNIEKVSKIYLIECDKEWIEALHYTFMPYRNKVVFCDKFLSKSDDGKDKICLDSLVDENVDYIKMDIEGEEENALIGARRLIAGSSSIKCSICVYHRHDDEGKIKNLLEEYGMKTYTSKGYMLFLYDRDGNLELRRGIVRGRKE